MPSLLQEDIQVIELSNSKRHIWSSEFLLRTHKYCQNDFCKRNLETLRFWEGSETRAAFSTEVDIKHSLCDVVLLPLTAWRIQHRAHLFDVCSKNNFIRNLRRKSTSIIHICLFGHSSHYVTRKWLQNSAAVREPLHWALDAFRFNDSKTTLE